MEFEFTLKYKLGNQARTANEVMKCLENADCTDALVGLGVPGYVSLEFVRDGADAFKVIRSALRDVKSALSGAELVEAGPDYVGLTDVADVVGMSRQNMRKLFQKNASSFPSPVHGGSASVWHLSLVLEFLRQKNYAVRDEMAEVANATMQVNVAREGVKFPVTKRVQRTIKEQLAA